jgi:drug/metabolite transporter (DMT)-like permease
MLYIVLAAILVSWIFVLFKMFPKYGVSTFPAIVINYVTACICGFIFFGHTLKQEAFLHTSWIPYVVLCGFLFIGLFLLMGISSQKNGVSLTSVTVKMSMAISMLMMIFSYNEKVGVVKILGIFIATLAVLSMSISKKEAKNSKDKNGSLLLVLLFIGCGVLDFTLNYVQNFHLEYLSIPLFSAIGLGSAGVIGTIILLFLLGKKKESINRNTLIGGILLGVPNYFSIFFIIQSYSTTSWSDSTVLAVMNVLTVLTSTLVGVFAFSEKLDRLKWIGLVSAFFAIYLFYISG